VCLCAHVCAVILVCVRSLIIYINICVILVCGRMAVGVWRKFVAVGVSICVRGYMVCILGVLTTRARHYHTYTIHTPRPYICICTLREVEFE
jgi:hypothetical protein